MKHCESDTLRAIRRIEHLISQGWSIQYARKEACGFSYSKLYKEVSKHPSYLPVLNNYMNKLQQHNQYHIKNGELKIIARSK